MPGENVTLTANFTEITGIENIAEGNISIFPNPTGDQFSITANIIIDRITIIDKSGQVVRTTDIKNHEANIAVHDFVPGIYYVRIYSEIKVFTKILVVQ